MKHWRQKMYLLIDNYDSFTYNIYNLMKMLGKEVDVYKNDEVSTAFIESQNYEGIVLSPGPSRPENAGELLNVIACFYNKLPILGICLGHQAIGMAFGGTVSKAGQIMHGKIEAITHSEDPLFEKIDSQFDAVRYHSLVVEKQNLPSCLSMIAISGSDSEVMGIKHCDYPVYGLQFHPESYLTHVGTHIFENFFKIVEGKEPKLC